MSNAAQIRICEHREIAYAESDLFGVEIFRVFGATGTFREGRWKEEGWRTLLPLTLPATGDNLSPHPTGRSVGKEWGMAPNTRRGILQVARTLFVRQGYAATSLRQVARGAGIAKATVYHHFPDKRAIMNELLRDAQAAMTGTLRALHDEEDPRTRLETAARAALRFLGGYADLMQIARREVPGSREPISGEVGSFFQECEKLIADAIARGRRRGIFRSVLPQKAARVFMVMLQGSFANAMFSGEKPRSPEKATAALLDVFFHGIDARAGKEES